MKKGGTVLTGERMERLVNSPATLDPERAKRLRYRVKRNIDGAMEDLVRIMDGKDRRLAEYAAERIRDRLLARVGADVEDAGDGKAGDVTDEIEDEMWG